MVLTIFYFLVSIIFLYLPNAMLCIVTFSKTGSNCLVKKKNQNSSIFSYNLFISLIIKLDFSFILELVDAGSWGLAYAKQDVLDMNILYLHICWG